jgi:hypothetical protein
MHYLFSALVDKQNINIHSSLMEVHGGREVLIKTGQGSSDYTALKNNE